MARSRLPAGLILVSACRFIGGCRNDPVDVDPLPGVTGRWTGGSESGTRVELSLVERNDGSVYGNGSRSDLDGTDTLVVSGIHNPPDLTLELKFCIGWVGNLCGATGAIDYEATVEGDRMTGAIVGVGVSYSMTLTRQ